MIVVCPRPLSEIVMFDYLNSVKAIEQYFRVVTLVTVLYPVKHSFSFSV